MDNATIASSLEKQLGLQIRPIALRVVESRPSDIPSFDGVVLASVRDRAPALATGLLVTAAVDPAAAIEWAIRDGHTSVNLPAPIVLSDADRIIAAARPLLVLVWTVNDPDTALALADAGVDGIFSDDPGLMIATYASR